MICVAAFIILCFVVLCIPVIRIFDRRLADQIWRSFKASAHCVGKRVTFRKCEVGFKDRVKNSLLKKVVLKKPGLVKPLGVALEVASVLVILVTVWSLLIAFKAGLSLVAYGTCEPTKPEACSISAAQACSVVDEAEPKNVVEFTTMWFVEIGDAFVRIGSNLRQWEASDYLPENPVYRSYDEANPAAVDIFDPGCKWCSESFRAQLSSGFFEQHNVALIPYTIVRDGHDQFRNSALTVRYLEAVKLVKPELQWPIVQRIFLENSPREVLWQVDLNGHYDDVQARQVFDGWLAEFGATPEQVAQIVEFVESEQVAEQVAKNREIVEEEVNVVFIPTVVYDGRRHDGAFKAKGDS